MVEEKVVTIMKHDANEINKDVCCGRDSEQNVKIWKLKKLIKSLEDFRGNRNLVSLIIPPCGNVSYAMASLDRTLLVSLTARHENEFDSLIAAIRFAQRTLKSYGTIPVNGLVLYAGTAVTDDGEEEEAAIQFEPFKPIMTYVTTYGSSKFQTNALRQLLECNNRVGFIIVDANGVLFGTLKGDTRDILYELDFSVDQSPLSRLGKTADLATQFYVNSKTSQANVLGLILAGPGDIVCQLRDSNMFDQRLASKIWELFHIRYGGEVGFNMAIEFSKSIVVETELTQEKELIHKCMDKFEERTFVFGVTDILKALDVGAVETLVVWEDLCVTRYVLKNVCTGEMIIKHLKNEQEADESNLRDQETGAELEVQETRSLIEWFADEYKRFGCTLVFVTNRSAEAEKSIDTVYETFILAGGMGALLRHPVEGLGVSNN